MRNKCHVEKTPNVMELFAVMDLVYVTIFDVKEGRLKGWAQLLINVGIVSLAMFSMVSITLFLTVSKMED